MDERTEWIQSTSPADPGDEIGRFAVAGPTEVDQAVERARAAFPAWRDAGLEARSAAIRRFQQVAADAREPLAHLITREMGKAIWDARGEAGLLPPKVDTSLGEGLRYTETLEAGPGARATHHPRGVLAVLGPFNFPAHLPNGHIVPALAAGNTVVFKPSELTPAVGAWMAEAWEKADLPPGVLQLVQGGADTGRTLAGHDGVDGVLFTGSWAAGNAIERAALDQPGKLVALELGGKNAIVVMDDADLDLAVAEAAISICATTGQRCSCASRLFVHASLIDAFAEKLAAVLRGVKIGNPLDESVFMGPLVSRTAWEKVTRYRGLAAEAGGERILEVEPGAPPPFIGPGLVRFADATQTHPYCRDEIFGPEAALYPIHSLEEGVAAVNDSDYGLVASVFTADRAAYEHCVGRIETGLLNWNKGTIGASGKLPFGGLKRSGNDRPAGVTASVYCTTPQAHIEHDGGFDAGTLPPGMPRP